MNIALIVFAGSGTRITSSIPKQFIKIKGHELVAYTINAFNRHPLIDEIVLVTSREYLSFVKQIVYAHDFRKVSTVVEGGDTRQASVRNGLNKTNYSDSDNILIHDGDRPLVDDRIITSSIRELENHQAVVVLLNSENALKEVSNLGRKIELGGLSYDVQTPQSFKYGLIKELHNRFANEVVSDDASLVTLDNKDVCYIEGSPNNFKVTTDKDLDYLKNTIKGY